MAEFIGKATGSGQRKMVPWWTEECKEAIKVRNRAFRKVKSSFSFADLVEYKKAQATVRRVIRKAKRERWGAFCNTIGRDTSITEVWGMIRRMGGIRREYSLPAIHFNKEIMATDREKAEALAKVFVGIHSGHNLSPEARVAREEMVRRHPKVLEKKVTVNETSDFPFSMFELKRALSGVRSTSPGKDEICYVMVDKLCPEAQGVLLQLFNMIWETGNIPLAWKHSVVVPVLKPGKEKSEATSYRPIALTSNLCKLMERMVTDRLTYIVEKRGLISPWQSGFRRGRMTMDPVLCLEDSIRKAQANKEQVNAVFFDIEKAYDMLWREGLLIKLEAMGISGRLYNFVMDFLLNRTIEVRVGQSYSDTYPVDNGVPQGSVCSPLLFSVMINDIFSDIDANIGKSLYADDGALWVRGRNSAYICQKLQAAVSLVENWGVKWGFRFSVEKTQVICFSKRRNVPPVHITLYGQPLKQVEVVRFLGVWMDCKLTFKDHIQRTVTKCKKAVNILRCLVGSDWGASMMSLKHVYIALIRSALDYASIAYRSAAKTHLQKFDVIQAQALRVCSGAFKTSSVPALQVEAGELPLSLRRQQLAMVYWTNLQGHKEDHPTKDILNQCWEHGKAKFESFGWVGNGQAEKLGLTKLAHSCVVPLPVIPPWLFTMPTVDLELVKIRNEAEEESDMKYLTNRHIRSKYYEGVQMFTDGSKDPETGKTAAAVFIPKVFT
ncbi:RNA-directed DNA polymerase from mobile element jockey [Engraulis encrasicolus]|uniref:RNA-directed DNA polymerase from mobile element jockey n=1 Tax=Engraulis encrasicolus TaxID=184585 RepID=UPI002FD2C600